MTGSAPALPCTRQWQPLGRRTLGVLLIPALAAWPFIKLGCVRMRRVVLGRINARRAGLSQRTRPSYSIWYQA